MYHGVGAGTPTCAPREIIAVAQRECARREIRGVGQLPGAWAGQDPCVVRNLAPCDAMMQFSLVDVGPGGATSTSMGPPPPDGMEPPPPDEEEEKRKGVVMIGGILLLLAAAGGGYYIYRRAKRKA